MALVKHARGVKLVLKVGDGATPENFNALCTINAQRSIKGTATVNKFNIPDCADPDLLAWISSEKVALEYTVNGAGIVNTPDVPVLADWLDDANSRNCQIVVDVPSADGGVIFEGAFHLIDWDITGDRGAKMQGSIALTSDGPVTVVANA